MKTNALKSLITGLVLSFCMLGTSSSVSAQLPGLAFYDSTGFCLNISGGAIVGWSAPVGTFLDGDTMDFTLDWGDGNIQQYLNQYIHVSGPSAWINGFVTSHTYAATGIFYISIVAQDHNGFSQSLTDSVPVLHNCGHIYGDILLDDGDGIFELGDDMPANTVPVMLTTSISTYGTNTNAYGSYQISAIDHAATTYHLEIDPVWLASTGFTVLSPASGSYNFTTPPVNYTQYPFLLDCGGTYGDASVSGYAWGFRAGFNTGYLDIYLNSFSCGGIPADIDLSVTFDPMLSVYASNLPSYVVAGNTVTSTINNLTGNAFYRTYFSVPGGTPASTPLVFNINENATSYTDADPANNSYTINSEVRNSWDPNDKSTNVAQSIAASVDEEIFYNIRFQNMGNDNAINITITDTIDSQLNLNSFRLVAQSHPGSYSIDVATRVVTFSFPNIMLPTESMNELLSQGYVRYKITEQPGLAIGTELNNTAYIYFDENEPVVTNTTSNINTSLGIGNEEGKSNIVVYPQPATEMFYISGVNAEDVLSISILDINGKAVLKTVEGKIKDGIYVGNLATGMYFVSIETKTSTMIEKLCIKR
jgi:uncharacterized repeat protein (TIGR01451 family)